MSSLVPREIVDRGKQPYRAPILRVLMGPEAPDSVQSCFEPEAILATEVLDPAVAGRVLAKCRRSLARGVAETDEMALVAILSTVLLHRQLVASPTVMPSQEPSREVAGHKVLRGGGGRGP